MTERGTANKNELYEDANWCVGGMGMKSRSIQYFRRDLTTKLT